MKSLVIGALIDAIGRLLGVIEKRANKPAPVEVKLSEALLKRSKDLN